MGLKKEVSLQIKNVLKEHPQGLIITDIVKKVKINRNTAGRYLENLLVSGQVEMRRFGMAKIYTLSQRVPLSALLSISSELVLQLDNSLRVIYANEPFLLLVGTDIKTLSGKNIEFTPVALLFDEEFSQLLENIKKGIAGKEWSGEINLFTHDTFLFCRIAPTVFEDGRKGVSIIFEDITQKKKTEEALKKSEVHYGSLIETTRTGFVIIDIDSRVITANQEYIRLTGRSTLAEIEGRPVTEWTAPYDLERNILEIKRCIRNGQIRDLEIDYQKPDGTIQPIEINASVIQSGPDKIIQTLCRDITERRKNEDALRNSEDKYRKLVEISPDAVIIHQQGIISYVNPAAVKLLGALQPDELVGKNVLDHIHPDFHDLVRKNIEKDLKDEISPSIELQMICLDGTSVIVEGRGVRTFINGKPAIQVALRNITERKHAEDALRESEGKLNAMLQSIPDIMSMMDEELTIMWANEPAKRYFGKDIVGKKCYEVYHLIQGPCEPYPCLTLKAFLDGKTHQHETTVIDSQGENRFFECTATVALRDNSGKPVAVLEISRDITDKKKGNDELRESEEKYRTLIERANDGIVVIQDNIVKMCNHYITDFWGGGTIDQMLGRNFTDFIHPDALPDVVNRYYRRMAGESIPSIYESILKRKDGSRFFAELNAGIVSFEGKPAALIIVRDINDRKKVQDALSKSEGLYRTLAEASNDLIFVVDRNDRVEYVNSYAAAIMNKTVSQIIGSPRHILFPPEVAKTQKKALEMVFEKGTSIRREGPLTFAGQTHWFDHVLTPLRDADNNIRTVLGISRDITERRRMEEELHESEEKYRSLVNRAKDVVCIVQDGIIKMCNPRLAEFWGGSFEEIIGRNFADFIHPEALPDVVNRYNRRMAGESPPSLYETVFMRKDGSKSYVELNAGIITYEGKNADLVIVRDINERKNATQAMYESEEKYRSLVTTTGDIIWETDDQAHFTFVSPQVESIIGYKPDDLIGHTPFEFFKPDTIGPNQKMFRKAIENKEKSVIYISQWIHKNGHSVYLESHAVPVYHSDGSFSGFIGIDRKKTL